MLYDKIMLLESYVVWQESAFGESCCMARECLWRVMLYGKIINMETYDRKWCFWMCHFVMG